MVRQDARGLAQIERELAVIVARVEAYQKANAQRIERLHAQFKDSGLNFLGYLALRQGNLKNLQLRLAEFGLSSLGRCESYVINNLEQVLERISDSLAARRAPGKAIPARPIAGRSLAWQDAEKILHRHTRDLFGPKPAGRHVYIMATAPSRPEFSDAWVASVLRAGANLIRINCAHDAASDWDVMVAAVRRTSADLETPCRILFDLCGPKIRTASAAHKKLSVGDQFFLVGKVHKKKTDVACSLPEALQFAKEGHRVLFDDGKIEAVVIGKPKKARIKLEATRVPSPGTRLKAKKESIFPTATSERPRSRSKIFAILASPPSMPISSAFPSCRARKPSAKFARS